MKEVIFFFVSLCWRTCQKKWTLMSCWNSRVMKHEHKNYRSHNPPFVLTLRLCLLAQNLFKKKKKKFLYKWIVVLQELLQACASNTEVGYFFFLPFSFYSSFSRSVHISFIYSQYPFMPPPFLSFFLCLKDIAVSDTRFHVFLIIVICSLSFAVVLSLSLSFCSLLIQRHSFISTNNVYSQLFGWCVHDWYYTILWMRRKAPVCVSG